MRWWKRLKKDNSEKLAELREELEKEGGVEKNDTFAMIVSAMLVFLPVALLVLLLLVGIAMLPILLS